MSSIKIIKSISLDLEIYNLIKELMNELQISSFSQFIVYCIKFYAVNRKAKKEKIK